jgi:uncharacterized small protein (DUF1192 family)
MRAPEHAIPPEDVMACLDGELPPDRAAAVHAHLLQCAACGRLASEVRQLSHDLAEWQPGSAPGTLVAPRVLRVDQPRWWNWWTWRRPPAWAAGVVVLILVAGLVGERWSVARKAPAASAAPAAGVALDYPRLPSGSAGGGRQVARMAERPQRDTSGLAELSPASRIIRTANLTLVARDFDTIRPAIDRILAETGGFVGEIQVSDARASRSLRATLRVPGARLAEALRSLGALGRVTDERQSAEDVTEQVVDLEARLANSRNTERRLTEVLKNRTGRVADVLEVEREIARVREEIERLDAQRLNLERRVAYATVTLHVREQRHATLDVGPLPVSGQLRNAFVDGLRGAYESAVGAALTVLERAPVLLLWIAVLWWPVRALSRTVRVRRSGHPQT